MIEPLIAISTKFYSYKEALAWARLQTQCINKGCKMYILVLDSLQKCEVARTLIPSDRKNRCMSLISKHGKYSEEPVTVYEYAKVKKYLTLTKFRLTLDEIEKLIEKGEQANARDRAVKYRQAED